MTQKIIDEHGRTCTKCGEYKPLSSGYYKRSGPADGYAKQCKSCLKANSKRNRVPLSRRDPRRKAEHKILKAQRENKNGLYVCWVADYNNGVKKISGRQSGPEVDAKRAWRTWLNDMASDGWIEQYYLSLGKPWANPRLPRSKQYTIRYAEDAEFNLNERMRRQIRKARINDGIGDCIRGAIVRGGSSNRVENELGYTIAELLAHLSSMFTKGMTMEKLRYGLIHVDHIMPKDSYDLTVESEWIECWSLSNLQPLWAEDNWSKSNKVMTML